MTHAKINLATFEIVEHPSAFPAPGALKALSAADRARALADPAAFFGEPVEVDTRVGSEDVTDANGIIVGRLPIWGKTTSDPCPDGARGFAWWPVFSLSPPLGLLETHGEAVLTVDQTNRRVSTRVPIIAPSADSLAAEYGRIEAELHRRIDIEAENRRLDFITPGDGQAQTYRVKAIEAEAIVAGATPSKTDHPFVWKEAAALDVTPEIRAIEILAMRDAWASIGSDIEAVRQGAKAAVTKAKGNKHSMEAAAAVDWAAVGVI